MKAYEKACNMAADKIGLPRSLVRKVYHAYWRAIRDHVSALPMKEELTDEEFMELQPNVNIPSIGKLHVTLDRYKRVKRVHMDFLKRINDKKDATHKED